MLRNIAPKGRSRAVRRARSFRANMSLPEVLLWQALRRRPHGLKFRRQHPTGPFILDFFCIDARLAVEIDGEVHSRGDRPEKNRTRDAWLLEAGIETLQVPARDVPEDPDAVLRGIFATAAARLPLHHPALPGGSPPRDELGED